MVRGCWLLAAGCWLLAAAIIVHVVCFSESSEATGKEAGGGDRGQRRGGHARNMNCRHGHYGFNKVIRIVKMSPFLCCRISILGKFLV